MLLVANLEWWDRLIWFVGQVRLKYLSRMAPEATFFHGLVKKKI